MSTSQVKNAFTEPGCVNYRTLVLDSHHRQALEAERLKDYDKIREEKKKE